MLPTVANKPPLVQMRVCAHRTPHGKVLPVHPKYTGGNCAKKTIGVLDFGKVSGEDDYAIIKCRQGVVFIPNHFRIETYVHRVFAEVEVRISNGVPTYQMNQLRSYANGVVWVNPDPNDWKKTVAQAFKTYGPWNRITENTQLLVGLIYENIQREIAKEHGVSILDAIRACYESGKMSEAEERMTCTYLASFALFRPDLAWEAGELVKLLQSEHDETSAAKVLMGMVNV